MITMSFALAMSFSFVDPAPRTAARSQADPPAADQFLIVPLRIHILKTPDLELANCKLEDGEVEHVVRNLNTIWRKAGIVFGIESIVHEAAVQRDRFRLIVQLNEGQIGMPDFQLLLPKPSRARRAARVFLPLAAIQRRLSRRGIGRPSRRGGAECGRRGN